MANVKQITDLCVVFWIRPTLYTQKGGFAPFFMKIKCIDLWTYNSIVIFRLYEKKPFFLHKQGSFKKLCIREMS